MGLGIGQQIHSIFGGYQPLAIYIGAIVAFLLSVFWKPQIGLYYLVPLLPMQTVRYWLHAYPFGEKLIDVLLLGVVIGLLFRGERPLVVPSSMNKVLLIFIGMLYISLWNGSLFLDAPLPLSLSDPRFSDWKNYTEMLLIFFVVAAAIRTPKQMKVLIVLMCISILLVNRTFHSNTAGRDYSQFNYNLRDAGPLGFAGENGIGAFEAEMAIFLIALAAFAKKVWLKLLLWGVAFTSVYTLVFTFSRGGYLGFLVGLLALGLIKQRRLLLVLVVILVAWQSFVPQAVIDRVFMTYSGGQVDNSAGERLSVWQDAYDAFRHDPAFGDGMDTFRYGSHVAGLEDTHNYYIKLLVEAGLVGICLFLWLLYRAGKISWQLFRTSEDTFLSALGCALFSLLACAAVVNLFGDRWTYIEVNGFFWVLLGCAARGLILVHQNQEMPATHSEELSAMEPGDPRTASLA